MSWKIFNRLYQRYDEWFDRPPGKEIFELEVKCVKQVFRKTLKPSLEVGIGTGRFAERLNIDFGVDPSFEMLKKALKRGVRVVEATAEMLPFPSNCFGTVALIVTLCFLDDPTKALKESFRILRKDGVLILGIVPKHSSWGKFYLEKKKEGHPFYSAARFYTPQEAIDIAEKVGFKLENIFSTLFESPLECENIGSYSPKSKLVEDAGFVCIRMKKP